MEPLPPLQEQLRLIGQLALLCERRGLAPFLEAPLLLPTSEFFPDAWSPSVRGARVLSRRLLHYAGLGDLGVVVHLFSHEIAPDLPVPQGQRERRHKGAAAWFAGIEDRRCIFGLDEAQLTDPEAVVAALCHEVAHAYRLFHGLVLPDRDEEERLTDLTTVYLGFGVLTTNASYRYRSSGGMEGRRWSHNQLGYLSPQAMSFLLASQALARSLERKQLSTLRGALETNQRVFFDTTLRSLDRSVLADRLRLPAQVPPPRQPAPLPPDPEGQAASEEPVVAAAVAAPDLPNAGRPVFRVPEHSRGGSRRVGLIGALVIVAAVLLCSDSPGAERSFLALLGGAVGYLFLSRIVGPIRRWDACSDPSCAALLPEEAKRCPRCGGEIRGTIARRGDRLAAEEALQAAEEGDAPGPRCPRCSWRPQPDAQWACRCGHLWNTFATAGRCPACGHEWQETQCMNCEGWSPHADWTEASPSGRERAERAPRVAEGRG